VALAALIFVTLLFGVCAQSRADACGTATGRRAHLVVLSGRSNLALAHAIDPSGRVAPAPSVATAGGSGAIAAAEHPSGPYVLVANLVSSDITVLRVDRAQGLRVVGATPAHGLGPVALAVHPNGRWVYVANANSDDIAMYSFNVGSGELMAVGNTVPAGLGPAAIVMDPRGRFAYVANIGTGDVMTFAIDPRDGRLRQLDRSVPVGSHPLALGMDPLGRSLYVANLSSHDMSAIGIDANSGLLRRSTRRLSTGAAPTWLSVHPSGAFLYVGNSRSNDVSLYQLPANGTRSAVQVAASRIRVAGTSLAFDCRGRFAYMTTHHGTLEAFTVDGSTGALTPLGTPVQTLDQPMLVYVLSLASKDALPAPATAARLH
jgi:6-phosphogluconolactonase (cycloisomerase 2 family)